MLPTFIELYVKNRSAELYLNGLPLPRISAPGQPFIAREAHMLLLNGKNELELVVEPGETPSEARKGEVPILSLGSDAASFAVGKVKAYQEGDMVGSDDGVELARVEWQYTAPQPDKPPEFFPLERRVEFDYTQSLGPWKWQQAVKLNLEKEFDEIMQLTQRLHQDFEKGDPRLLVELQGVYTHDLMKTMPGESAEEYLNGLAVDVRENAGREGWVRPFDPDLVDLRLVADGRLVELVYRDWAPVLTTLEQPDGDQFEMPLFLGKVDGSWQILY